MSTGPLQRVGTALLTVLERIAMAGIVFLMLATTVDVVWRSTVGGPIRGVQDYSALVLIGTAYAGLSVAQRDGAHVYFELIDRFFHERVLRWLTVVGTVALLVVLALAFASTLETALDAMRRGEYRLGLARAPAWPSRFALPVGFLALAIRLVVEGVGVLRGTRRARRAGPAVD